MIDQWYYSVQGQPHGPVPFETLRQLAKSGVVTGDSHVRNTQMQEWRPWSSFTAPPEQSMEGDPLEQLAQAAGAPKKSVVVKQRTLNGVRTWHVGVAVAAIVCVGIYIARQEAYDPRSTFERACDRFPEILLKEKGSTGKVKYTVSPASDNSIDVVSTNSLTAPYRGTFVIRISASYDINTTVEYVIRIFAIYQDNRWVYEGMRVLDTSWGTRDDRDFADSIWRDSVERAFKIAVIR
jgi:hypothetical protein